MQKNAKKWPTFQRPLILFIPYWIWIFAVLFLVNNEKNRHFGDAEMTFWRLFCVNQKQTKLRIFFIPVKYANLSPDLVKKLQSCLHWERIKFWVYLAKNNHRAGHITGQDWPGGFARRLFWSNRPTILLALSEDMTVPNSEDTGPRDIILPLWQT